MIKTGQITKKDITVLYVEDEDLIRNEITTILKIISTNVISAPDGAKGLEAFKNNHVDLIITDINMPFLNGFEMLKAIREINAEVPAIILSAYSQTEFIKQASQIDNINDYLLKPVDITQLLEKININIEKIEEKKAYKKTLKLLEQYKIAVDNSTVISKTDTEGIITYANEIFCRLSGFTKEELIGNTHSLIRHSDMQHEFFQDLWKTIKTDKKIWKGKIKNRKKDGDHFIVNATIVPILDNDGNIEEFIAIRHDITELEAYKKILEKQLHTQSNSLEEKIHLVGEYEEAINLATAMVRINSNFDITYANAKFLEITKLEKEDILNINFKDRFITPLNKNSDHIIQRILDIEIWQGILKATNKNNEVFYVDFTFDPILDKDGNIIEYMGLGNEITDVISLHKEIEETQKDVIFSLGTIGEARSKETGNHVKRVAEYSYLLAKKLGLTDNEAELIRMASPMHDIGKVGIPDNILNKPQKFTPQEFEFMKTHSTIGYNMLRNSNREILRASATIAHEHHERYDGSGYPRGLKGNEIHIFGRITAVADVFDALGSDRCYKKAWELEKILKFFEEEKGKHFDPYIIELFLNNLDEFLEIRNRYRDDFDELEILR